MYSFISGGFKGVGNGPSPPKFYDINTLTWEAEGGGGGQVGTLFFWGGGGGGGGGQWYVCAPHF